MSALNTQAEIESFINLFLYKELKAPMLDTFLEKDVETQPAGELSSTIYKLKTWQGYFDEKLGNLKAMKKALTDKDELIEVEVKLASLEGYLRGLKAIYEGLSRVISCRELAAREKFVEG